ncbi:venom metalloproteinase antarease TserMP_A-like isoform X2 [Rhipicephalus microplus]|uniref:venom metalloproteinase antarease TserMP_A-like isoform X2 n=1 Tax=Rhipicephalus microplus TaxID=6941 RepID=UPI003F6D9A5B
MESSRQATVIVTALLFCLLGTTAHSGTLVYPRLLESRADDANILLHVNEALTLNLRKSSILAKEFVITSTTKNHSHRVVVNGLELERDLYHDTEHRSSLLVTRYGNGVEVRGILNDRLRIAPAVFTERSDGGLIPHTVFSVEERSNVCGHSKATNKSKLPDNFTVELCVVVGPVYQRAFNRTKDLVSYIGTMLNAVSLVFTDLTEPAIKLQLNGILTPQDQDIAGRTICGLTVDILSSECICATDILSARDATVNLVNSCQFTHCDLALQLLSGNLAMAVNDTHINTLVNGVASVAEVCSNDSAVVAQDNPLTYSGVLTVAHEIAHALGATHDGEKSELVMDGYPNDLNCTWEDEYLMSPASGGKNSGKLSNCTKEQIKFVVSTLPKNCIKVSTEANYSNKFYPGQNMTPETFCKTMHPQQKDVNASEPNGSGDQQCTIECCWKYELGNVQEREVISIDYPDISDESSEYYYGEPRDCEKYSTPEAMPCGENKTCRQGVCGEHNWTEIYNLYRTYRTFQTI